MTFIKFRIKTGAGEGIRTLDPNLGQIRLYEIYVLNCIFISTVKKSERDPNIFSAICSEGFVFNVLAEAATLNAPATRDPVFGFPDKCRAAALRPNADIFQLCSPR